MPKFLERRLHAQAAKAGIQDVGHYVYGAMQNMGVMRGRVETAKGKAMAAKHAKHAKRRS